MYGKDGNIWRQIIPEYAEFHDCVHKYKQLVTCYLTNKYELWNAIFMYSVFYIDKVLQIIEFGQFWYAIHSHLLIYVGKVFGKTDHITTKLVRDCVYDLNDNSNCSVAYLDHFINQTYNPKEKFKDNPAAYLG